MPHDKRGRATDFIRLAFDEVAFGIGKLVEVDVQRGELLQRLRRPAWLRACAAIEMGEVNARLVG